jgi:hypothetical protein
MLREYLIKISIAEVMKLAQEDKTLETIAISIVKLKMKNISLC